MPQLTWDSLLMMMLLGGVGLGFLLRKAKIITYILSIYLSFILANELGLWITRGIRAFLNTDVSLFYLKFALFVFTLVLLATEEHFLSNQIDIPMGIKANFEGALYGFLMGGLFLSQIFELMDGAAIMEIQTKSIIAAYIIANRIFLVIIPIVVIAISSILRRFKVSQ